jgi:hypothetical protein
MLDAQRTDPEKGSQEARLRQSKEYSNRAKLKSILKKRILKKRQEAIPQPLLN